MSRMRESIRAALQPLVGLKLSIANYAGNMRIFHFGEIVRRADQAVAQYAMHLQCPWRIEGESEVVTGLDDWYLPPSGYECVDESWEPGKGNNLQQRRLRELFRCPDEEGSLTNRSSDLVVIHADGSDFGDCRLILSGSYVLNVFPCSSDEEAWRLFQPGSIEEHFVVSMLKTNGDVPHDNETLA
jgi:hypothetical protein